MCGFFGILGNLEDLSPNQQETADEMFKIIAHRGPDDRDLF